MQLNLNNYMVKLMVNKVQFKVINRYGMVDVMTIKYGCIFLHWRKLKNIGFKGYLEFNLNFSSSFSQ